MAQFKFYVAKIPLAARICYGIGLSLVFVCFFLYYLSWWPWSLLVLQQTFIVGALIVVIGSVINTLAQFGRKK